MLRGFSCALAIALLDLSADHVILLRVAVGGGGNRQHESAKDTARLDAETEELKRSFALVPGVPSSMCTLLSSPLIT